MPLGVARLESPIFRVTVLGCAVVFAASGCQAHYAVAWTPPRAVFVASEPPPPVAEPRPPVPYQGAVWVEGHYDWNAEGWVWLPGAYVRPRTGHVWVAPQYGREPDHVRYVPGHWQPASAVPAQAVPVQGVPVGPSPPPPTVVEGQAVTPSAGTVEPVPPPPTVVR